MAWREREQKEASVLGPFHALSEQKKYFVQKRRSTGKYSRTSLAGMWMAFLEFLPSLV
jgi:hypothetical protein